MFSMKSSFVRRVDSMSFVFRPGMAVCLVTALTTSLLSGCNQGGGDEILIGHFGSMTGSEATLANRRTTESRSPWKNSMLLAV